MSWELHAAYGGLDTRAIAHIMSDRKLDPASRAGLLSAALATRFKEVARADYQKLILDGEFAQRGIAPNLDRLAALALDSPPAGDLAALPPCAWLLSLNFRLAKPYLSQDDDAFYVIDNPVRKDKVFKVPMVGPASWKGSLRAAATFDLVARLQALLPETPPAADPEREALLPSLLAERARSVLLFGQEKRAEACFLDGIIAQGLAWPDELDRPTIRQLFDDYLLAQGYVAEKVAGRQGRLYFFPTFFDRIGLEIINPHLRDRRVGKNPIPFECVPAGGQGWFHLLYVPFDLADAPEAEIRAAVAADFPLVARAVQAMLTVYGFGAKTSSGYGLADAGHAGGAWRVNLVLEAEADEEAISETWVREIAAGEQAAHWLKDQFFDGGRLIWLPDNAAIKRQPWGGGIKATYRKLRKWLLPRLAERPTGPQPLAAPVTGLAGLPAVAGTLAAALTGAKGGDG